MFLNKNPNSTVNELASAVSINAISVRHHINSLLADGVIESSEQRHGVGRPRLVYSLTEKGYEIFPSKYFRLTNRLLGQFKETLSTDMLNKMFIGIAKDLAEKHRSTMKKLSIEERLNLMQNLLEEEGFNVDWEQKTDHFLIHGITCPYFQVALSHPEVCTLGQTIISEMLNIPINRLECQAKGDQTCSYIIPHEKKSEKTI